MDELADRRGQSLFEVCARLAMRHGIGLSRQAISRHIDVLEQAGLVRVEWKGRSRYHYLQVAALSGVQAWIQSHIEAMDGGEP